LGKSETYSSEGAVAVLGILLSVRQKVFNRFLVIVVLLALDNDLRTKISQCEPPKRKITPYLLAAIDELIPMLFREILFAEELLTTVGHRICMLLRDGIRETVAHASDLVHETSLLEPRVVAITHAFNFSMIRISI
jgi:hypothetical protein